jgi:polar amino acid transport system substrate-binding protein
MKMRTLATIVALCSVSALLAGCSKKEAVAAKKTKIIVASDATWPPMEYLDENKQIVGFSPDMLKAISEVMGVEIEIRNTAWDGIFAGLAAGSYDVISSSVTITDERKATMDFSEPYANAGQVLVVPKATEGVTTIKDLAGKQLGAQIGTTGAIEIGKEPSVTLKSYDEVGLAFEDLGIGRIDGVVADSPIAANFALQNPKFKDKLKIVGTPFTEEWLGLVVRKGDSATLSILNEGLAKIKASGKLEEIANKWLR